MIARSSGPAGNDSSESGKRRRIDKEEAKVAMDVEPALETKRQAGELSSREYASYGMSRRFVVLIWALVTTLSNILRVTPVAMPAVSGV